MPDRPITDISEKTGGDKVKVTLLTHTPDPERYVAAAAKLCYSKSNGDELTDNLDKGEIERFLDTLMSVHHESPLEHVSFTFAVDGVSRALSHQLVRHRMASYSQQSQRYVKLDQFEYIIPPNIEKDQRAKELYIKAMKEDQKVYDELVEILTEKHYQDKLSSGVKEEKAKREAIKLAIEDARYVFPNGCETKIVMTMNARSLKNFFEKRCCERAQWEIRELATEMLRVVKSVAPTVFKTAGPPCVSGPCKEGAMTCGKATAIREFFTSL